MSKIVDNFGNAYDGIITIECDDQEANETISINDGYIDISFPKIIKVSKTRGDWPAIPVTVDKDNVTIESYCCCGVSQNDSVWEVTPNTGANDFCLKISAKPSASNNAPKSFCWAKFFCWPFKKQCCCGETADPDVTVTIG